LSALLKPNSNYSWYVRTLQSSSSSNTVSGYRVVAYLPNPDHTGKVVIFAGTGSEATEAAGEFLTSEDSLANFLKILYVSELPCFEVSLKTTHRNHTYRGFTSPASVWVDNTEVIILLA